MSSVVSSKSATKELIHFFLQLRNQIKLYHWQTRQYSRHMATDKTVDALDKSIDQFVEIYIGKYGRPATISGTLRFVNLTESNAEKFIKGSIKYLQTNLKKILNPTTDTDLLNIRDTITGDLNQLLYLFTLR
jgi:DNA-binding ferritin-like protein